MVSGYGCLLDIAHSLLLHGRISGEYELEGSGNKQERNRSGNMLVLAWENRGVSQKNLYQYIRCCGWDSNLWPSENKSKLTITQKLYI